MLCSTDTHTIVSRNTAPMQIERRGVCPGTTELEGRGLEGQARAERTRGRRRMDRHPRWRAGAWRWTGRAWRNRGQTGAAIFTGKAWLPEAGTDCIRAVVPRRFASAHRHCSCWQAALGHGCHRCRAQGRRPRRRRANESSCAAVGIHCAGRWCQLGGAGHRCTSETLRFRRTIISNNTDADGWPEPCLVPVLQLPQSTPPPERPRVPRALARVCARRCAGLPSPRRAPIGSGGRIMVHARWHPGPRCITINGLD